MLSACPNINMNVEEAMDLITTLTTISIMDTDANDSLVLMGKVFLDKCDEVLRMNPHLSKDGHSNSLKPELDETSKPVLTYINFLIYGLQQTKKAFEINHQNMDMGCDEKISVKNLAAIMKCLDFLLALTVRPFIDERPCESREGILATNNQIMQSLKLHKIYLLTSFVDCLNDLLEWTLISNQILSRFLHYLVAICAEILSNQEHKSDNFKVVVSKYKSMFRFLLKSIYQPFLMRELLSQIKCNNGKPCRLFCCQILTTLLMRDNDEIGGGLTNFLLCCLDMKINFDDFTCCQYFVALISTPPKIISSNNDDYYDKICKLINCSYKFFLFDTKQKNNSQRLRNFFVFVLQHLWNRSQRHVERRIIKEALEPLTRCLYQMEDCLPSAGQLSRSIEAANYFLGKTGPRTTHEHCGQILASYLPLFLQIHEQIKNSATFLKTYLIELTTACLESCIDDDVIKSATTWLIDECHLSYGPSDDGGINAVGISGQSSSSFVEESAPSHLSHVENWVIDPSYFDKRVDQLMELIDLLPSESKKEKQYALLLYALNQFMESDSVVVKIEQEMSKIAKDDAGNWLKNSSTFKQFLAVQSLLDRLIEIYDGPLQLEDKFRVLKCCLSLLKSYDGSQSEIWLTMKDGNIQTCLLIVAYILSQFVEKDNFIIQNDLFQELGCAVQKASDTAEQERTRELAKLAFTLLQDCMNQCDTGFNGKAYAAGYSEKSNAQEPSKQVEQYEEAFKDVTDELVPVKTHGLIVFTNLLKKRDATTVSNLHKLIEIFFDCLLSDESYIFLPALNALSIAGEIETEKVLNFLLDKFSPGTTSEKEENRLKIGEVVVKISRTLGDIGPHYGPKILNVLLYSLKTSKSENIRASSLSNISEICKLMSFKLTENLHELFNAVSTMLCCPTTEPLMRRACVHFFRCILCVDDKAEVMLQILQGEISNIYRILKKIYLDDDDHINRLHAQLCLDVLNDKLKESLFTDPTLFRRQCTVSFKFPAEH